MAVVSTTAVRCSCNRIVFSCCITETLLSLAIPCYEVSSPYACHLYSPFTEADVHDDFKTHLYCMAYL